MQLEQIIALKTVFNKGLSLLSNIISQIKHKETNVPFFAAAFYHLPPHTSITAAKHIIKTCDASARPIELLITAQRKETPHTYANGVNLGVDHSVPKLL